MSKTKFSESFMHHAYTREFKYISNDTKSRVLNYWFGRGGYRKEITREMLVDLLTSELESATEQTYMDELADIAYNYHRVLWNTLDARQRERHPEIEEEPIPSPKKKKTVYQDSQNVHNTSINNTVKEAAKKLVSAYPQAVEIAKDDLSCNSMWRTIVSKSFNSTTYTAKVAETIVDIRKSTATFNIDIRIEEVLFAVWFWHLRFEPDVMVEIRKRVREEITDMSRMCSTGKLARTVNICAGFDPEYEVKISDASQARAVVFQFLETYLRAHGLAETFAVDPESVRSQVEPEFTEKLNTEWVNEYGSDFDRHAVSAFRYYFGDVDVKQ